ncbi:hypothetical protein BD413DRAFT_496025 [Trametes elegans]|nr:hypothetical protein BD413DRAFT_496025 [Trametes elegans]
MNLFAFANVTSVPSSPVLLRAARRTPRTLGHPAGRRSHASPLVLDRCHGRRGWRVDIAGNVITSALSDRGLIGDQPRPVPRQTSTPAEAVLEKAGEGTVRELARKSGLGEGSARASPPRKVAEVENAATEAQGFRGRLARSGPVDEERARESGAPGAACDARAADAGLALPASGSVYEELFGTGSGGQTWETVGGPVGLKEQLNDSFAGCVSGGAVIKTTVGPCMYVSLDTSKVYIVQSGKSPAGRALMKKLVGLRHARAAAKANAGT